MIPEYWRVEFPEKSAKLEKRNPDKDMVRFNFEKVTSK